MAKGKYKEWQTPEGLALLRGWARDGLVDAQIAHNIGIRRPTLYEWKKRYPDIADALKKGKEVVDREVENALLKRAVGMTTVTKTYRMMKLDDEVLKARRIRFLRAYQLDHPDLSKAELQLIAVDKVPTYERVPFTEVSNELPPDNAAAMFWLKNRKPEKYRDRSFQELNKAQARKALADSRKAEADADVAKYKADLLTNPGGVEDRTVVVDDFTDSGKTDKD